MTRNKMIELLIEDRIRLWVYARLDDGLREMLSTGFTGFDNYSTKELKEAIEELDDEMIEELKGMIEWEENKDADETLPF